MKRRGFFAFLAALPVVLLVPKLIKAAPRARTFTASGTWNKPKCSNVLVVMWGSGGLGGTSTSVKGMDNGR